MHTNLPFLVITFLALVNCGCNSTHPVILDEAGYIRSIEDWQDSRLERLKGEDGWLNLTGLFWLREGENSFGSDPSNDIVFPDKAEAFCGTLTLKEGKVFLKVAEDMTITSQDVPVTSLELHDDHAENTTLLKHGDFAWYIIKRDRKYGIRLRDYKHPRIESLDHIPAYPISTDYVVEAKLEPFEEPRTMTVATPVEGFTESYQCPGKLHFTLNREDLVLYPFTSGKALFLIIADKTTGIDTYGAGRFMHVEPDSAGRIILDFNKAYNPPCAFSPFATCPMSPGENFLNIAVEAGEKSVHLE
jgi:uncharacterized protein (DUF1684 family)